MIKAETETKNNREDTLMTPMTMFLLFVGVCAFADRVTRFLIWVDEPECR